MHGLIFEISISRLAGSTRYPFRPFHASASSSEGGSSVRVHRTARRPKAFPKPWQIHWHKRQSTAFHVRQNDIHPETPAYELVPPEQPHAPPREQRRRLRGTLSEPRTKAAKAAKTVPKRPNPGGKWLFQCVTVRLSRFRLSAAIYTQPDVTSLPEEETTSPYNVPGNGT